MKKGLLAVLITVLFFTTPSHSYAWGKKGHELVAEIAYHLMDSAARETVKKYLAGYNFGEAANWMDDSRSNSYFDYMRPWHYFDMEKGEVYKPSTERNLITVLHSAINELKNVSALKKKDIKRDLLLIFHLVGDLHQPLHTGYASDKGGNTIEVRSQNFSSNLHSAWDTQILETESVSFETCMKLYSTWNAQEVDSVKKINVLKWYYQSRAHMDTVYDFKNGFLDQPYIAQAVVIIKRQLVSGGIRLASVLDSFFKSPELALNRLSMIHFMGDHFPSLFPLEDDHCCREEMASHG